MKLISILPGRLAVWTAVMVLLSGARSVFSVFCAHVKEEEGEILKVNGENELKR